MIWRFLIACLMALLSYPCWPQAIRYEFGEPLRAKPSNKASVAGADCQGPTLTLDSRWRPPPINRTAPPVVRVLFAYTGPEDHDNMVREVNEAVNFTNSAFHNSGTWPRVEIAGIVHIEYAESGNLQTDLVRLACINDGHLDDVHRHRDDNKADVVSLWVTKSIPAAGFLTLGIAYQPYSANVGYRTTAFNVVFRDRESLSVYRTFTHELGHNLGAGHSRKTSGNKSGSTYPYAFGYFDRSARFRTIMSYLADCPECEPATIFSNPFATYNGATAGVSHKLPDWANNAQVINDFASTVASYR